MTEQDRQASIGRTRARRGRLWLMAAATLLVALVGVTLGCAEELRSDRAADMAPAEGDTATPPPDDLPVLEDPPPDAESDTSIGDDARDTGGDAGRGSQPDPALEAAARRQPHDGRAIGAVDAPVVLVQWADFLCGFCRRFTAEIEPVLLERFVETGLLRIEWRDLPIGAHEDAWLAARGGHAAAAQGAFFAYRDVLYAAELRRGQGELTRELLLETAAELDLDVARFAADLDAEVFAAQIADDAALAAELGIDRTPSVGIGGYLVPGLASLDDYVRLIEFVALESGATLP